MLDYPTHVNELDEPTETANTDYLTVSDVAKRFKVTERAVQKWIRLGYFPGTLQATRRGHYRIPLSAVEQFERSRRIG